MSFLPSNWVPSSNELLGKTVLVTGASDGIGRSVALACAAVGAEVWLLARQQSALETVYDEILEKGGKTPGIIPVDLIKSDTETYQQIADQLCDADIALDGLVHNASILGERKPLAHTSLESWRDVLQVNIGSIFLLTRFLMPLLQAAPMASLILTSSGVGRRGKAYWGAYAVSKFATEGFMQVLADELRGTSRIRVNSLNPGAVNTKMRRAAYPAEPPNNNPLPEELTDHWVYLLSDLSQDLNGAALNVQS